MCCEADEHQPALEESKQNTFRQKLLLKKNFYVIVSGRVIHYQPNRFISPYLLRNFEANVRTKPEHVLHLLNRCRDEWDI